MADFFIFHMDLTLCDFMSARDRAVLLMTEILHKNGIKIESFEDKYWQIQSSAYNEFTKGKIGIDEYHQRRHTGILSLLGSAQNANALANRLNKIFSEQTNENMVLFDDVEPVLAELVSRNKKLAILTNGPTDGQLQKYKSSGLDRYIDTIFIGEQIGFFKPDKNAFLHVLEHLDCKAENAVMVGDSLSEDYEAARKIGMQAILLDRNNRYAEICEDRITTLFDLPTMI